MFEVTFIDYGNTALLSKKELLPITWKLAETYPDLRLVPAMALEACLTGVKPNPIRDPSGKWDQESID